MFRPSQVLSEKKMRETYITSMSTIAFNKTWGYSPPVQRLRLSAFTVKARVSFPVGELRSASPVAKKIKVRKALNVLFKQMAE